MIAAIDGLAGVGKTSLVIHWAHRVSEHFPAGALYLDLRGHDPYQRPMPALEALGHLLDAMGVPAGEVPGDLDARTRAYRSALGGGRWLVVLDNAASAAQVRPMLPGARPIFTVVTSRSFLGGLVATEGAYRLAVSPMTTAEAQDLLSAMIGPDRAGADGRATFSLISACGRLPLALRVAAAQLVGDPGRSVAGLAAQLTGARRLDALRLDGDDRAAVPAAFDLSYQALSPAARQAFLLLGALPAREVSGDAITAASGRQAAQVASSLAELTASGLVQALVPGRFGMHDLVRHYAARRAEQESAAAAAQARRSLLIWFLSGAQQAVARLGWPRLLIPPPTNRPPRDRARTASPMSGRHATGWRLSGRSSSRRSATPPSTIRSQPPGGWPWSCAASSGSAATPPTGPRPARRRCRRPGARAPPPTGPPRTTTSGTPAGVPASTTRRSIITSRRWRRAGPRGWATGEAGSLSALGSVRHEQGHFEAAIRYYQQALELGDTAMPVPLRLITVGSLGLVYQTIGHPRAAIDAFSAAMALAEELNAADHVATSLGNLGLAHLQLGDLDQARDLLNQALLSYRQVGSRNGEANVLSGLATLDAEMGRYDEAAFQATLALRIARDIQDRRIECDALLALGSVLHQRDDLDGARLRLTSAIEVGRLIGYERGLAPVLARLASVELALGEPHHAAAHAQEALRASHRSGDRAGEAAALMARADVGLARGEYDAARQDAQDAIRVCEEAGLAAQHARASRALHAIDTAVAS